MAEEPPVSPLPDMQAEAEEVAPAFRPRPVREKDIDEEVSVATLEEIQGLDVPELAKDKSTSRLLQRSLLKGGPAVAAAICEKAEPGVLELVRDQHGAPVIQKVLAACQPEQFGRLFTQLSGEVKELAADIHGTRVVQKVVEQAVARGMVSELLAAVPEEVMSAIARNAHGFHVVVKFLECLPAQELELLLDLLVGTPDKALALGCDQWGCCVLKKCIGRSEGEVRHRVVDSIVGGVLEMVQDPYGNYVVQHLFMTGQQKPNSHIARVVEALRGRIFDLCLQKFSSNVLEKCLRICADKERDIIINELLTPSEHPPSEAVQMLLFHQFGNYVFQQALEMAREPQYSLLVQHARPHIQESVKAKEVAEDCVAPSDGRLSAEHARRLSQKLIRRHHALCEGSPELQEQLAWSQFYGQAYCADDFSGWGGGAAQNAAFYGFPFPGFDVAAAAAAAAAAYPATSPPARSKGKRSGSARKTGKQSQTDGGGGDVFRVGRIVGYWPNYSIAYDEAPPAPPAPAKRATSSRDTRSKRSAS